MPDQIPAQIAYAAYGATTGGLNHRGEPMPAWEHLGDTIQAAWTAAANAVLAIAANTEGSAYPGQLSSPDARDAVQRTTGAIRNLGPAAGSPS